MAITRASRPVTGVSVSAPTPTTAWESLDRRQVGELTVPGAVIGLLGAVIAGGLAAAGGLSPGLAVVSIIGLGLPLAAVGAYYEILLAKGRVPLGPMAPMAIVWVVGFPAARVIHALVLSAFDRSDVVVAHGWLDFVVYNILLSVPFAIGFWWLHENFAPRWWMHLEERNPVAAYFMSVLVRSSERRREASGDGRLKGLAGMQERRLARRRGGRKQEEPSRRRGR